MSLDTSWVPPPRDLTSRRPAATVAAMSARRLATEHDEPTHAAIRDIMLAAVDRACPGWLRSEREDIVHDAMTRLTARLASATGGDRPSRAYLAKVAYHALVDEIRRQARGRSRVALDELGDDGPGDRSVGPEAAVGDARIGAAIRDCLSQTVATRRAAVGLYLEGRGPSEVAAVLELSRKQADNLVHRGLADLRRCLDRKGVRP